MESFFHLSLDFLGLSSVPGLEVGGYLDSMLISPIYYVTLATSFILVGLSLFFKMETKRKFEDFLRLKIYFPIQE